jgi:hypothetical protein
LSQQAPSTGLDVVVALIIAVYGALLSTYSVWASRQEKKREIKVQLVYGFLANPPSVGPLMLILSALNTGHKTVTLTSMGLLLPKRSNKYLVFARPENNVSLNTKFLFSVGIIEGSAGTLR